jgi:O-antigen/teichoic acid export membrane protein
MKSIVQNIYSSPNYEKILKWGKLISITGFAQLFVQGIGLISGILVIRLLPTQEYALYTLANTMLGTMTVLADGGISTSVMSQGGKVWENREKLGVAMVTGMNLRRKFAIGSLLISTPILFYLLQHHGASLMMSGLLVLSLVPAFLAALSNSILQVAPKLHQDIAPLQKNHLEANIGRLIMLFIGIFIFPFAYVAIIAAGLPQLWTNMRLKAISQKYADWTQKPDKGLEKETLNFVKRILPGSIYYCLSGQITIWLISIFGSTTSVAQVGALGRLAMMLTVFNVIINTVVVPRFARLNHDRKSLLDFYLRVQGSLILVSLAIVGVVWLFPSEVLWVLGKDYSNLQHELVLSTLGSCLGLIVGASFSLSTSRSWAINPFISVTLNILIIILGIIVIDISSLTGILMLNISVSVAELILYVTYCLFKIYKPEIKQ